MLLLYTMTKKIAPFVMRLLRKYHMFGGMETFRSRNSAEVSISKSSAAFINPWFFNLQDFSEALGGSAPSGVTRVGCQRQVIGGHLVGSNPGEWKIMEVLRCL